MQPAGAVGGCSGLRPLLRIASAGPRRAARPPFGSSPWVKGLLAAAKGTAVAGAPFQRFAVVSVYRDAQRPDVECSRGLQREAERPQAAVRCLVGDFNWRPAHDAGVAPRWRVAEAAPTTIAETPHRRGVWRPMLWRQRSRPT